MNTTKDSSSTTITTAPYLRACGDFVYTYRQPPAGGWVLQRRNIAHPNIPQCIQTFSDQGEWVLFMSIAYTPRTFATDQDVKVFVDLHHPL